jgi:hypothetical protein
MRRAQIVSHEVLGRGADRDREREPDDAAAPEMAERYGGTVSGRCSRAQEQPRAIA